jgi:hypothetical protein
MDCSRDLLHYKLYLWIFPLRKIEIVSVGIRAILDPRMRLVEPNTSLEAKHLVGYRTLEADTCFSLCPEF